MDGKVSAFDEHRGLGEITAGDGAVYPFHCTPHLAMNMKGTITVQ